MIGICMGHDVNEDRLTGFRAWLLEMGRAEGTAALYVLNVRACARHKSGLTGRLVDKDLAPKTLHTNRAALEAWADYTDDDELAKKLRRIKLPPSRRVRPKRQLERDAWKKLIECVRAAKLRPAVKAVILIMALRGLRSGDVLRLRKREVEMALKTGEIGFDAKGRRRLEYRVTPPVREALELLMTSPRMNWQRVEDTVVCRCRSEGLTKRRAAAACVARALVTVAKCVDGVDAKEVHPHRLRRTYAVYFLQELRGDPQALIKLQQHMGWDSLATAASYVDAVDKAEVDAIGDKLAKELA